ncbi:MAG: exopolysaccharide biosynthesis polyprenyl glycosylphosphotransferase [Methylobacteriaceae bacterium]|nr:exopolysaccharide biosynthesis polyprenyl glycosylphosphotransferase [Methylobacteriaceae bacterium]
MAALADVCAITLSAILVGTIYHWIAYGVHGMTENLLQLGLFIALIFVLANVVRQEYAIANYLSLSGHGRRSLFLWNVTFIGALASAFVTKTTADFSRVTFVAFYFFGLAAICATRATIVSFVKASAAAGGVSARRVFLVGFEADMHKFMERYDPWKAGMHIVAASVLRKDGDLREDLALAAASARMMRPDDVFVLVPWSDEATIDACLDAFLRVPASLHLGPERVLDRFVDARIHKIGEIASLNLIGRPLSTLDVLIKRAFDVVAAAGALVLLWPLFLLIALLIKRDSPGPVLFFQRRYGFNQEPFRIAKFRTMSTLDDDRHVKHTSENDERITRIGRWMRRYNIDELPQLLNVLRGEMTLVGPRPHALAHDQQFEQTIALYARRHNVKPGITGWAQVNGFRGGISNDEKIRMRIEHDLFYIDNWTLLLDLRILFLTVFSRKAYRNAF